jgi:type IV secretory pathway VirB3-like protein
MPSQPILHPVYQAMNKPLTIFGVERRLFLLSIVVGSATFTSFGSLLGGLLMSSTLMVFGRLATHSDPQILRVILNSARYRTRYDPVKRDAMRRPATEGRA